MKTLAILIAAVALFAAGCGENKSGDPIKKGDYATEPGMKQADAGKGQ